MDAPSGALHLPSAPQAAALARQYVHQVGSSWPSQVLDSVLLAVSEAVTNAVRYGQGGIQLRLAQADGTVRIEVSDSNPAPPTRRSLPLDGLAEGGHGLHLLDALTHAWGSTPRTDPPGKTVWMLLPGSARPI